MSISYEWNFKTIERWAISAKFMSSMGLFLIILLLGYFCYLQNHWNKTYLLKEKITTANETLLNMQQKIITLKKIANQEQIDNHTLSLLIDNLAQDFQIPSLLEIITASANELDIKVQLLKPLPKINFSFYDELPYEMIIKGNYQQIARFVTKIVTLNKIVSLENFNLEAPTSDYNLQLNANLKIYCYKNNLQILKQKPFSSDIKALNIANYEASNADPFNPVKISTDSENFIFDQSKSPFLTMNFKNLPVKFVLQKLATFAKINLVMSEHIDSNISLQLQNVSWQQAMEIILVDKGLIQRQIGNVYLIAPAEEIANVVQKEVLANQRFVHLEKLQAELIPIQYGNASDIVKLLHSSGTSILSERGNISADERTNTIWLQDIPAKFSEIHSFIKQLDIPAKQVLIEARIVSIDQAALKELGVRFGITKANLSGTLSSANYFATSQTNQKTNPLQDITQRLNLDLPVSALGSGSIGLALAKLGSGILLDLELSALEHEGNVQIIASPRLITANQKEAVIQAGEEIPFQQTTSSGATSVEFKKAVLSLKVTPRITLDNSVLLTLIVNQDKRGAEVMQGVPAIDTQEITTQVLVNNGQTIVIGGVYRQDNEHHTKRVPFLSDLPLVGKLFQYQKNNQRVREMMIFITPKIVKQSLDGS